MTRFKISLAILLLLLLLSAGSVVAVRHAGNTILDAVEQLAASENPDVAQCETIEAIWEKAEPWLLLTVRRDKIMDTSNYIYRLKPMLESNCDEFTAELKILQSNLEFLMQEDGFSLQMLL